MYKADDRVYGEEAALQALAADQEVQNVRAKLVELLRKYRQTGMNYYQLRVYDDFSGEITSQLDDNTSYPHVLARADF